MYYTAVRLSTTLITLYALWISVLLICLVLDDVIQANTL